MDHSLNRDFYTLLIPEPRDARDVRLVPVGGTVGEASCGRTGVKLGIT